VEWAVLYYFGLQWVATDAILAEPHWEYVHAVINATLTNAGTAGTDMNSISDLAYYDFKNPAVAREPDFFEMLRQGVLRGSAQDIMILDRGASIIDQFTSGDLPTAITNGPGGSYRGAFGKKNIPYLSQMLFWPYRPKADPTRTRFDAYLAPMFWNPHRNASTVSSTVNNFRITLTSSVGNTMVVSLSLPNASSALTTTSGLTTPGTLNFTTSSSATYQEPTIFSTGTADPPGGQGISEATDGRSGFYLGFVNIADKKVAISLGGTGTGLGTYTKASVTGGNSCTIPSHREAAFQLNLFWKSTVR
jgi:hypothetical protein